MNITPREKADRRQCEKNHFNLLVAIATKPDFFTRLTLKLVFFSPFWLINGELRMTEIMCFGPESNSFQVCEYREKSLTSTSQGKCLTFALVFL